MSHGLEPRTGWERLALIKTISTASGAKRTRGVRPSSKKKLHRTQVLRVPFTSTVISTVSLALCRCEDDQLSYCHSGPLNLHQLYETWVLRDPSKQECASPNTPPAPSLPHLRLCLMARPPLEISTTTMGSVHWAKAVGPSPLSTKMPTLGPNYTAEKESKRKAAQSKQIQQISHEAEAAHFVQAVTHVV
ncbi:hypothetical protein AOLI_G00068380 [Acnodon oligacanthus]